MEGTYNDHLVQLPVRFRADQKLKHMMTYFMLDFSKAFDTVPHSILLDKLSSCEMKQHTLRWAKNWPFDIRKPLFTKRVVKHRNRPTVTSLSDGF